MIEFSYPTSGLPDRCGSRGSPRATIVKVFAVTSALGTHRDRIKNRNRIVLSHSHFEDSLRSFSENDPDLVDCP